MGPKDETSAKAAEIGDGLIEALGFEPADGKKLGRSAVAEVSDQLSEAGFSVTDTLDDTDEPASSGNGDNSTKDDDGDSMNGSASGNGSSSSSSTSGSASETETIGKAEAVAVIDTGDDFDSTDWVKDDDVSLATVEAETPSSPKADSNGSSGSSGGKADAAEEAGGTDVKVDPLAPGAKAPVGPPTADTKIGSPSRPPSAPAVTGEIPRVDAPLEPTPTVVEQPTVGNRSIVDRPKSVSDLFSGGITGRRRLQARKVRRVIRHIDPWSVLTFSVMFHLCLFAALLLASALVFNVAEEAGTIENLESFIRELGDYETFEIDGQAIFKAAVAIAGIMTLAASVLVVLLTVMFNLLSDLLGGVRITVIEEETVRVKPKNPDAE